MLLQKSIDFASNAHKTQFRKSNKIPYICHPFDVLNKLIKSGISDEDMHCCAMLHDVLEDCPEVSKDIISNEFNENIANIVQELTFDKTIRKDEYILSFENKSIKSLVIKLCDRICNLEDFAGANDLYFLKYKEKSQGLFSILKSKQSRIIEEFSIQTYYYIYNNFENLGFESLIPNE